MGLINKILGWFKKAPGKVGSITQDPPPVAPEVPTPKPVMEVIVKRVELPAAPPRIKIIPVKNPNKYWRRFKRNGKVYYKKFYKSVSHE